MNLYNLLLTVHFHESSLVQTESEGVADVKLTFWNTPLMCTVFDFLSTCVSHVLPTNTESLVL